MSVIDQGKIPFRPYARLISVLGDQLISSKWVGVIELVKNSYDADANQVSVRFIDFDKTSKTPVIEIEDDGDGMTISTILNVWMKPATPHKLNRKKSDKNRYTNLGRLMQGDKGVGRFAVYKLGNKIEIFTKTEDSEEVELSLNFHDYAQNDEFANKDQIPEKFLDEVENIWQINETPKRINNTKKKGTLIKISDLRNSWKYQDLERLQIAFQRMIPPTIPDFKKEMVKDFDVEVLWNGIKYPASTMSFEEIIELAPFSFRGSINSKGMLSYNYKHNKKVTNEVIDLFNIDETKKHDIWKLPLFKDQYLKFIDSKNNKTKIRVRTISRNERTLKSKWIVRRKPNVGSCEFFFYAFDWRNKMGIKSDDERFIKDNSVYLYRDYTRVYPYGEKGIDWLMLSKLRAEDKAGHYFSYNDLIGFIFVSQEENPKLRDAASREGLVNIDGAYDDFVALIQATLKVMKDFVEFDKRKDQIRKEKAFTTINQKFNNAFEQLKKALDEIDDEKTIIKAQKLFKETNNLVTQYNNKLSIVQELAGLGMAVEKSSHDIFILIKKLIENAADIIDRFEKKKLSSNQLKTFIEDLTENLKFLYQEVQILQPLFRVARKVTQNVSVRDTIERVQRYYRRELQFNINFKIEGSGDIIVKTNVGLVLQVFINLIDNAIYWLNQKNKGKREILVKIDSARRQIIVADNGHGIDEDLAEVVFLEFYSSKAEGRGLGLYIVKELLERISADISLITTDRFKVLPGANFLIQFDEAE